MNAITLVSDSAPMLVSGLTALPSEGLAWCGGGGKGRMDLSNHVKRVTLADVVADLLQALSWDPWRL